MNENEKIVTEQPEIQEQVTPPAKTYTQEEVDAIVGKRLARQEAKIRKENDRRYGPLMDVLKAGTGKESVEEVTDTFKNFYASKGVQMPQKQEYSQKDLEVLAKAEADEIIRNGFEDVIEETDRLAAIGVANMTAREKAVFKTLAEHRQAEERRNELNGLGASEDVINSQEFKDFQKMFHPDTPISKVYETYQKTQPKKEIHTTGSMKHTAQDSGVKDYYSYEEASKFTKKDFDNNPALFRAVERSMAKW